MRRVFFFLLGLAAAAVGAVAWARRDDLRRAWGEWQAATAKAGKRRPAAGGPKVNGPLPGPEAEPGSPAARVAVDAAPADGNAAALRCAAETRGGRRCSREAEPGSRFCWQHA